MAMGGHMDLDGLWMKCHVALVPGLLTSASLAPEGSADRRRRRVRGHFWVMELLRREDFLIFWVLCNNKPHVFVSSV